MTIDCISQGENSEDLPHFHEPTKLIFGAT